MKKLTIALAVALVLSMAGIGAAATLEVNIYGASAQLNFWSSLASQYLTAGPPACHAEVDNGSGYSPTGSLYHGAKYFIAEGQGPCAAWTGLTHAGDIFRIRVASYDSGDGIQSVASGGTTNPIDALGCLGHQRTQLMTFGGGNNVGNLGCEDTHLGAADVNGSTIIQHTEGQLDGPQGPLSPDVVGGVNIGDLIAPSDFVSPAIVPQNTCTNTNLGLIDHHPIIVPFAFYANTGNGLANNLAGLCTAGTLGCSANTVKFCDPNNAANCVTKNVTNGTTSITQAMIEDIFSGAVTDWDQFFPSMPSTPIIACMRTAGSGTMATFDAGVMSTNYITPGFPGQDWQISGGSNMVWFNNTTTDLMNCVNGILPAVTVPPGAPNGSGSIGFADADQSLSTGCSGAACPNVFGPLYFNGQNPTAYNIEYGLYDRYWTSIHIRA